MAAKNRHVLLLSMTLIMALALAGPVQAENEVWAKGDEWAVGTEEDFSELFDELTRDLRDEILANASGFVDYQYDNEGKLGLYYVSEVADDTNDLYEVRSELGFYIHAYTDNTLDFTAVPVAGNHSDVTEGQDAGGNPTWEGVRTQARTVTVKTGVDLVVKVATDEFYDQMNMTLQRLKVTFTVAAGFEFRGTNIPEVHQSESSTWNEADGSETYDWYDIQYHDVSWGGEVTVDFVVDLAFEPGLDLYNLPITAGEVWGGKTNVTASGDFGGVIDLDEPQGVPQEFLDEFYEQLNSGFDEANLTKTVSTWTDLFPLNIPSGWMPFDELNEKADEEGEVDLNLRVAGNRFRWGPVSSPEPLEYNFTTGEQRNLTLPDGTTIEAFEIIGHNEEGGGVDEGRGYGDFREQIAQGQRRSHTFQVDHDLEELQITWDLSDDNTTVDSNLTLQLKDDRGNLLWQKRGLGAQYDWNILYPDELTGSGLYTLEVTGDNGDMTYDIEVETYYVHDESGLNLFPEMDLKPFFGAESGRIATVDLESETLAEAGVELTAPPVEPAVAQQVLARQADPADPTVGGVNENRDWNTEPTGDDDVVDDNPLPSPGLVLVAALMGGLALAHRRKRV